MEDRASIPWRKRWPKQYCAKIVMQTPKGSLIEYEVDLTEKEFEEIEGVVLRRFQRVARQGK